jgi:hypothetical protein
MYGSTSRDPGRRGGGEDFVIKGMNTRVYIYAVGDDSQRSARRSEGPKELEKGRLRA